MLALIAPIHFLSRLRAWATGHWLRGIIVAGTILGLIAITMAGWAYLASVAIHSGILSVDAVIALLDEGRYEEARAAVGQMLQLGQVPEGELGGPLYVLGAVKMADAEKETSGSRRQGAYLIASRYLTEARAYGVPPAREGDALFRLGQSLIEGGQPELGIEALDEICKSDLAKDKSLSLRTHQLLADACLFLPQPKVERALAHDDFLLASDALSGEDRISAVLHRAGCLSRMNRTAEARQALASLPPEAAARAEVELALGRITLDEVESTLQKSPTQEFARLQADSAPKVDEAFSHLKKAASLDDPKTQVSRHVALEIGRGLELKGDVAAAARQYAKTRQQYDDTLEGMVASLCEADLMLRKGNLAMALSSYRRVLEGYAKAVNYRSNLLPIDQLRRRMLAAVKSLLADQHFAEAHALLENFPPLFSRAEQLELRGNALEQWGTHLISHAKSAEATSDDDLAAGYQKLRAAGQAYEQLAELRFATKQYTEDLWRGAENYSRGHSFSSAIRLLTKYLDNEPELRNAQALLRLGQAHLALGHFTLSIAAFEECIEFHPQDSSTFQARIDCAKAHWHQGTTARAEQLLRDNLSGSSLKPSSTEWKDSLFELGMLLHEQGLYEAAIDKLEEAVTRYPQDPQRLMAQYLIGESYRRSAQSLLDRSLQSKTASEHDKNRQLATERLTTALEHFEEVQRAITLKTHDIHSDPLMGAMLRNCYMLEGAVLFDLERYKEAIEAYSNVSSLYPDEPFVLETFVQIANCWRRLNKNENARGAVQQAQIALERLPPDSKFDSTTALNRDEWRLLLADMSKW
jgi:tetratricopeptide (TPR) repeat protein